MAGPRPEHGGFPRITATYVSEHPRAVSRPREPFLAWPGWRLVVFALALGTLQTLWWVLIYHGTGAVTAAHPYRVRLHLDAELAIPFVPASILIYQSLTLAFLFAPFILRSRRELEALCAELGGRHARRRDRVPSRPRRTCLRAGGAGAWASLYEANERIALRTNLLPSLHVAMSALTLGAYASAVAFSERPCSPAGPRPSGRPHC